MEYGEEGGNEGRSEMNEGGDEEYTLAMMIAYIIYRKSIGIEYILPPLIHNMQIGPYSE